MASKFSSLMTSLTGHRCVTTKVRRTCWYVTIQFDLLWCIVKKKLNFIVGKNVHHSVAQMKEASENKTIKFTLLHSS